MVHLGDRTHGNGLDTDLVADAICKRRLVHAAIDRLGGARGLAGGYVDEIAAGCLEEPRHGHGVVGRVSARRPVVRRNAHAHGLVGGPDGAHGGKHLERVAAALGQIATVVVGAQIGQWRDEARQQITVRAVQLEPVKAGLRSVAGGLHKLCGNAVHVSACHGLRQRIVRAVSHAAGSHQGPVAGGQRLVGGFPADLRRTLGAAVTQLHAGARAVARAVNEVNDALPGAHLRLVPQTRAAGGNTALCAGRRHLGKDQRCAAQCAGAQVHQMKILRHALDGVVGGHRRDHDAVLQLD